MDLLALSASLQAPDHIGRHADLVLGLRLVGEAPGVLVDGQGPEGPGRCGALRELVLEVGVVQLIVRVLAKDEVVLDGTGVY